jgi:hypothetical protein
LFLIYKRDIPEYKCYIRTNIICWWYKCHNFKQKFRRFLFSVKFTSQFSENEYNEIHTKESANSTLHVGCKEKLIEEIMNTLFLGLQIYNHLNCKNYIEQMIPKLCAACHNIGSMVHISSINTLKSIYYAYFHSVIKYWIIFWGNPFNNGKTFTLQKKIIRTTAGAQSRTSCRCLFKQS